MNALHLNKMLEATAEENRTLKLVAHPDILDLLESYWQATHERHFTGLAVVMVGAGRVAAIDWAGDIRTEPMLLEGVELLQKRLGGSIEEWSFPPHDESLDASYVRYNLCCGPLGFDFLVWLIRAEMNRIRHGAPAPLKVGFWKSAVPAKWLTAHGRRRQHWLDNVFRPMLGFIGAVEDERAVYGHCDDTYLTRPIVEDSRKGIPVPMMVPPRGGVPGAVTITLREKRNDSREELIRNSNVDGWVRFAEMLQRRGETVIVIRDTAKADEPIPGITTHPTASRDLSVRMALYGAAKMNWFVENGPASLCHFSTMPWVQFWNVDATTRLRTPTLVKSIIGSVGDQYPWSQPNQRIVWAADTYDNIVSEWESHSSKGDQQWPVELSA